MSFEIVKTDITHDYVVKIGVRDGKYEALIIADQIYAEGPFDTMEECEKKVKEILGK